MGRGGGRRGRAGGGGTHLEETMEGRCEFCPLRPGPCCVCGGWAEADDDRDGCGAILFWGAVAFLLWTLFLSLSMLGG